jgi:acyl-CoA synthetase (AMP-forming)/AMP-acid ligase II
MNHLRLPLDHLYRGYELNPDAIAAQDPTESISYKELKLRVEALALGITIRLNAAQIQSKKSHSKNNNKPRVGLCAQNHIDHFVAHLAIITAGLIWIPINPKNGIRLNKILIDKSQPSLILSDQYSLSSIPNTDIETLLLHDANQKNDCRRLIEHYRGQDFPRAAIKPDDVFGIKFTGGTTGEPKGVIQTHRNLAAVIDNMQDVFTFTQNDCNLAVAPLTHGGSHYLFPLLGAGGRQLLLPNPNPNDIIDAFKNQGASVSFMPPTLIYKLLDQPNINKASFPKLRHLTYSAAPMPPDKIAEVINKLGPCLSTVYGQTEAPMTITAMSSQDMQRSELRASVGKACKHSQVAILDSEGRSLLPNSTGEIAVRGSIVMPSYFQDEQKTRQAFLNGWLLTGDLGYLDDNEYLFLQGRSKELIISGGFNVYPAEVENALMAVAGISECAAFGVEDDYWGERVEAAVCLTQAERLDHSRLTTAAIEKRITDHIKPILGDVKTPKRIHVVDQLPRNPVGKVVRREVKSFILNNKIK